VHGLRPPTKIPRRPIEAVAQRPYCSIATEKRPRTPAGLFRAREGWDRSSAAKDWRGPDLHYGGCRGADSLLVAFSAILVRYGLSFGAEYAHPKLKPYGWNFTLDYLPLWELMELSKQVLAWIFVALPRFAAGPFCVQKAPAAPYRLQFPLHVQPTLRLGVVEAGPALPLNPPREGGTLTRAPLHQAGLFLVVVLPQRAA
jgi:hypothetical protein